ncbi:PHP domain-containing protein [Nocardioides yefusunii]|uniref:PHP domain-containing protein n=1 Tax=Nocardioides yefusunii TaxID=2500546 RepID=A0ABW1QYY9_9ACTN|nr:PHP domain-containing protein [Nocardioides yefusunii]
MRIDLHTHSLRSDGSDTPRALVAKAAAAGLDVVALTDHDTVAGWDEAVAAGAEFGVAVVCGIELSVTDAFERDGVRTSAGRHLLAYGVDPTAPALAEILARAATSREDRAEALFARLEQSGLGVDRAAVTASAGGIPSRKHVAAGMVAAGHASSDDDAFARFLNEGREFHVERYRPSVEDAIAAVHAAGGVAVIAHPRDTKRGAGVDDVRMAQLREAGLDGVEVDHQSHDAATRADLRVLAGRLGLWVTGSSDHHGDRKVDHDLGCNLTDVDQARGLLGDAFPEASHQG